MNIAGSILLCGYYNDEYSWFNTRLMNLVTMKVQDRYKRLQDSIDLVLVVITPTR